MPSMSQTVTVTERQDKLMASIASSEKSGELTAKEAASLRKDAAKIVERETKMESKNGGKMSYANINEIEKALNKLSNKLHKNQLAKRVTH
jgi:hypothetical protein